MPDISNAQQARNRTNNGIRHQVETSVNYMLTEVQKATDIGLFLIEVRCNYSIAIRQAVVANMRGRGFTVVEYDRDEAGNSIRLDWSEPEPPRPEPVPVRAPIVAISKPATPKEFPEKQEEPEPPKDQSRWTQI